MNETDINPMGNTNNSTATRSVCQVSQKRMRKERIGQVVSAKMEKTCVVETITRAPHPRFGKIVKHRKRFYVHDESGSACVGDIVRIVETRPVSRLKRWRMLAVITR